MDDTYQHHVDAALGLLQEAERRPRKDTDLKRILVASALAHAAATREAGDAIVGALDELRTSRRA